MKPSESAGPKAKAKNPPPCYFVSELTKMIQSCLESKFPPLQVQGEISNFTAHSSGHWYFTLKDENSQIRAVMFRSMNQKLNWKPKRAESLSVKVLGQLSVYKPRGEYQIICEKMEKCGKGAEEFEKIKEKLKKEGLFERKRPLPALPRHIVIISSPTGAAIRDILNILKRRHKGLKITLVPALVQGEGAPESLRKALSQAKKLKTADLLIITRGGGSLEDLWAFNDPDLARDLFQFPLPVISAVGHEVDFTICDFVADLRAPTPSAGAELSVQNAKDLNERIRKAHLYLYQSIQRKTQNLRGKLESLKTGLLSPQKNISAFQQNLDDLSAELNRIFNSQTRLRKEKLSGLTGLLESLSPLKTLSRGYCLVNQEEKLIKQAEQINLKQQIHIRFHQSFALARVFKKGPLPAKEEKHKKE